MLYDTQRRRPAHIGQAAVHGEGIAPDGDDAVGEVYRLQHADVVERPRRCHRDAGADLDLSHREAAIEALISLLRDAAAIGQPTYGGDAAAVGEGVATNQTQRARYDEGILHGGTSSQSSDAYALQAFRKGHAGDEVLVVEGVGTYLDKGVVHAQVAHRGRNVEVALQHLEAARAFLIISACIYQRHLTLRHMLQYTVIDRLAGGQDEAMDDGEREEHGEDRCCQQQEHQ